MVESTTVVNSIFQNDMPDSFLSTWEHETWNFTEKQIITKDNPLQVETQDQIMCTSSSRDGESG